MDELESELDLQVYVINYKNDTRKANMETRFEKCGIVAQFVPGCGPDDPRLNTLTDSERHAAPCMFSHLECLYLFLTQSKAKYCIVCEDDVHLRRTFKADLPRILEDFDTMGLDILLLGYLLNTNPRESVTAYPVKNPYTYSYHDYNHYLWGTQMYLVTRTYAAELCQRYSQGPPPQHVTEQETESSTTAFASDWTITKDGKRALIYPMLAVEEGGVTCTHAGQAAYHAACHRANYDETLYY